MAASGAGASSVAEPLRLRAACRVALAVAAVGEAADPRVPAPPALVPILRHSRLSAAAYASIARILDEDGAFRARVASSDGSDEASVGRTGWLWLNRPEGWLTDSAVIAVDRAASANGFSDPPPGEADASAEPPETKSRGKGRKRADESAARRRAAAERTATDLRNAKDQLAATRRDLATARAEAAQLRDRLTVQADERNQAVRRTKQIEKDLAAARGQLKSVREAHVQAEAELLALRRASTATDAIPVTPPVVPLPGVASAASVDAEEVSRSVAAAAEAANDLGRHLAEVAASLTRGTPLPDGFGDVVRRNDTRNAAVKTKNKSKSKGKGNTKSADGGPSGRVGDAAVAASRGRVRRTRAMRRMPSLPPGLFDGTPEADRHLLSAKDVLLLVDGYNLARAMWSGLEPQEERRRVVARLEEVRARSKASVVIVFDGATGTVAPAHSRSVRVRFSATGVTADEEMAAILAATPLDTPVLVVSSDRAVMADARRQGAAVMASPAFTAATGR